MNARAWSLFCAVSVLWGIPYLLIKVSIDGGMTPFTLAWGRLLIAGALLLAFAARNGSLAQLRGHWYPLLAYAVIELSIPLPLIAVGERHIASSLTAIVVATVPLLVALIAFGMDRTQTVSRKRLVGLLIGFIGVALLVGLDATKSVTTLLAVGAVFIAAIGYACGPLILNRHLMQIDPLASMGATFCVAGMILTPLAVIDWPTQTPTFGSFSALVALALVCSAAAFVLMAQLIAAIGPGRAVVITYVNPVVALALGVIFLSEQPGIAAIAGLVLILGGSRLATSSGEATSSEEAASSGEAALAVAEEHASI